MMQAQKRSRRTAFSVQRLLAVLFSAQQFQHAALGTCADGRTMNIKAGTSYIALVTSVTGQELTVMNSSGEEILG